MKKNKRNWKNLFLPKSNLSVLGLLAILAACVPGTPDNPVPKPKGWARMELPPHEYQTMDNSSCPFTFECASFGEIEKSAEDSCWMDIYFPPFECRWHITYRYVPTSGKTRAQHYEEHRRLMNKHNQQVTRILEKPLSNEQGSGVMYELYGKVGVPAGLYFGDSTNLIMVSFYFDHALENDSLGPIVDYMKEDLKYMVASLQWK